MASAIAGSAASAKTFKLFWKDRWHKVRLMANENAAHGFSLSLSIFLGLILIIG